MVYSDNPIISRITKPTSNVNLIPLTSIALAGAGAEVIMNDDNNAHKNTKVIFNQGQETISLWQFIRMYTIAGIPIIDFIIFYVIIYIINAIYLHYDYKLVLIITVPITILFNILTNKKLKISWFIVVAMVISIYYLVKIKLDH